MQRPYARPAVVPVVLLGLALGCGSVGTSTATTHEAGPDAREPSGSDSGGKVHHDSAAPGHDGAHPTRDSSTTRDGGHDGAGHDATTPRDDAARDAQAEAMRGHDAATPRRDAADDAHSDVTRGHDATTPREDAADDAHADGTRGRDATTPREDATGDAHAEATRDARSDASPDADGGVDATFPIGPPITATNGQWTWVPFADAVCANGASTGIGVNLSAASSRVLIYLEGGGACWDELTCYELQTASYVTSGYGASDFANESTDDTYLALPGGFFDRTSPSNPFKDYSYVYVPYCTGDVFAGDNVTTLGTTVTHFVGYTDMGAYLARIVPTFPSASRVILAGSSAGGFGAGINWWRTQQAFGSIRVDLIDDSGTVIPDDAEAGAFDFAPERAAWNLAAALPPGCTTCDRDLSTAYGYYDSVFASHRGALLSYTEDSVLPTFFGITTAEFTNGLDQDLASYFQPSDALKSFVVGASGHVLWFSPQLATSTNVTVEQFVTQMVSDDPSWTDEGP
jgi:hypothetical protein